MRILLTIKSFEFGGAENHVCDLANTLSDHGHKVFIIAGKGRQVQNLRSDITFIPLRFKDYLLPIHLLLLLFHLRDKRIDLIHAHQRLPVFISCLAGRLSCIPVISTVHGRPRYDLRSRFSRKNSNGIIFVSDHILNVSARFDEMKHKSVVIPNGVKVTPVYGCKIPFRVLYLSRTDKKHSEVVLMLIEKVLPDLIKLCPEITLQIIGTIDYSETVTKAAETINRLNKKTVCSISRKQDDLSVILSQSSVVLGVGRVALESLSLGTPVLVANYHHLGEIVSLSNYERLKSTNFVEVDHPEPDPERFILMLKNFFDNQDYWQNETNLVKSKVLIDFDLEKITNQIENYYNDTLAKYKKKRSCENER